MIFSRLALALPLAAVLISACTPAKTPQTPGEALAASVIKAVGECHDSARGLSGFSEESMDLNTVAKVRDTCNASSATIANLSPPPEMPAEQAELFAIGLHECATAQSNIAEMMGLVVSRSGNVTDADRSRANRLDVDERQQACAEGVEKAVVSGGGKLSDQEKRRLSGRRDD